MICTIIFDGGTRWGNPGPGYGSYCVTFPDGTSEIKRLDFEKRMTSNEAEYNTLLEALAEINFLLSSRGFDSKQCQIKIKGDSQIVIHQLNGIYRVKEPRLKVLWQRAKNLASDNITFSWHPREISVRLLGH